MSADDPTKMELLTSTLLDPCNGLETVLMQLLTERALDTASGIRLDAIGKLVGQDRDGLEDDVYRRYCRARVATSRSNGTRTDVYRVARMILDDASAVLNCSTQGPAAFVLTITGAIVTDEIAEILASFLRDVASAGVRSLVQYQSISEPNVAHFDLNLFDGTVQMIPQIE